MGVERLRTVRGIETGIITGEDSVIVKRRAEKLKITEIHMGVKDKKKVLNHIMEKYNFNNDEIAYIGDDTNDIEVMNTVGLSACPADATIFARETADVIVENRGGYGAFRDFAELIIKLKY